MQRTTTLCDSFRALAYKTFDHLGRAKRVSHQPLEETITDTNMLELKERNSRDVVSHVFSKSAEGRLGADWEWWITNPSRTRWLGLRVQAKILNLAEDKFLHLHYRSGGTSQARRLEVVALRDGLVPLYCLYLHSSDASQYPRHGCGHSPEPSELYGCSLISVAQVAEMRMKRQKDLRSALSGAVPWHCLVRSDQLREVDLPGHAWAFARQFLMPDAEPRAEFESAPKPGIRPMAPAYVYQALKSTEPVAPPKGVRGLLILGTSSDG